tara:strand:+ start:887 stop:1102 length:216 start_codon:yes stop_codon:yes gene_type:complete
MKITSLKLNIDLISLSSNHQVKTPILLRNRDYSSLPLESPNSIKHRIIVIETEGKSSIEEGKFDNTKYFYK